MAGIKEPIVDILNALKTIPDFTTVRLWNNQTHHLKEQNFVLPAAFVEVSSPEQLLSIGGGFSAGDVHFKIHVVHEFLDAQDGSMDQDLTIFDLKEKVVAVLSQLKPTACGLMQRVSESQSHDHDNVNFYIIEYITHFIDSKASTYDPYPGKYMDFTLPQPPDIEIDITEVPSIDGIDNMPQRDFNL